MGASGCVCVCVLPGYLDPFRAPFLIILGAKWAPFWSFWGSKSGDFGVLGPPGGRLGAMLEPMAGQRGASSQKGTKRLTLGRPFWEPFSLFFRIFSHLFGDLNSSRFLDGFWPRFWRVLGSFLGSFFGCAGSLFRCVCGSGKCGLDLLFAVNQAHGHLPTQAEKVIKYANFGGRFLDALWDGILGHFWHHFGSILGPFWGQNGQKRRSKNGSKKGRQKSRPSEHFLEPI